MGKYVEHAQTGLPKKLTPLAIIAVSYLAANQDRSVQLTDLAVDPRHLWRCVQENARASWPSNRLQTKNSTRLLIERKG
jgi:hypothetical protein